MRAHELSGRSLIGQDFGAEGGVLFHAVDPITGATLLPRYHSATRSDLEAAAALAAAAAPAMARLDGHGRAALLRAIALQMEAARGDFEQSMPMETGLPLARVQGELARTVGQLRLFADLVEEGSWVDARIDHADADRQPVAKPDVRSMLRAVGPVAVFGASNFPLAFSVAGGDTASALAAGCPVIVKAHAAHPATSERAARAVRTAIGRCDLPQGCFSLLFDAGHELGAALVRHPVIRAVGFTGSELGGRALMDLAAARPEPIPVYAEMSSVNPVFVLPQATEQLGGAIAAQLHAAIVQGAGPFCTRPGVVVLPQGAAGDRLRDQLAGLLAETSAAPMLSRAIAARYAADRCALSTAPGVTVLAGATSAERLGMPALFEVDATRFRDNPALREEVFGPAAVIVRVGDATEMRLIAQSLRGQLTATVFAESTDGDALSQLLEPLSEIAGRVVLNGVPTGVEVCAAMMHGGPYPASSDPRSTSVGSAAIERFVRRVCFQNLPDALLPPALRDSNPLRLWRLVDGRRDRH